MDVRKKKARGDWSPAKPGPHRRSLATAGISTTHVVRYVGVGVAVALSLVVAVLIAVKPPASTSRDPANTTPHASKPIEFIVTSDAETLDPRYATDAVGLRATRLVHAGLARLDADSLQPTPYAARRWTWVDPLSLRVELRDDVQFHSGAPLRTRDVVETIAALKSKVVASRHARVVEAIDRITEESELSFTIHLSRPHATLLTDLEVPILRFDEAHSPPRPDGDLDGLGPFSVTQRQPGAIMLSPAHRSASTTQATSSVVLRTVHDENARFLRLVTGRADVVMGGLSPTLLPTLNHSHAVYTQARKGANTTYLLCHTERPYLNDPRIRQALSVAIDRSRITRTLLGGHAEPASTMIPPLHWTHSPRPPIAFDPTAARQMLDRAWPPPRSLTLLTSTDRVRGSIARFVAQELNELGLNVHVRVVQLELGTMLSRLSTGDYELAILQIPELTEPNVLRVFMHSTSIPPYGSNRGRVRDPEIDRLLDQGAATLGTIERKAIYGSVEARIADMAWLIPLWHEDHVAVVSERARAFLPSAEGRWLGLTQLP